MSKKLEYARMASIMKKLDNQLKKDELSKKKYKVEKTDKKSKKEE